MEEYGRVINDITTLGAKFHGALAGVGVWTCARIGPGHAWLIGFAVVAVVEACDSLFFVCAIALSVY
jgi:hypothetical protein